MGTSVRGIRLVTTITRCVRIGLDFEAEGHGLTDVGKRLRELRKAAALSIVALAGAADVDPRRSGGIERGEAVPTMQECYALERAIPACNAGELGRLQYGDDYRGFPGFDPD
jgi:hypothetical protein